MTTVVTQFALAAPISRDEARRIFLSTAPRYRGLPGLVRKYYHVSEDGRTTGAVYLWQSRADAERLYTNDWARFVFEQYGVHPSVAFFDCPVIVDNVAGMTTQD
jgi:hypothetical protein